MSKARKLSAWQAALIVFKETGNDAVMWGDEGLLHLIADKLGWEHEAWKTSDRVMAALNKTPGKLLKKKTLLPNGHVVSIFYAPKESTVIQ